MREAQREASGTRVQTKTRPTDAEPGLSPMIAFSIDNVGRYSSLYRLLPAQTHLSRADSPPVSRGSWSKASPPTSIAAPGRGTAAAGACLGRGRDRDQELVSVRQPRV